MVTKNLELNEIIKNNKWYQKFSIKGIETTPNLEHLYVTNQFNENIF